MCNKAGYRAGCRSGGRQSGQIKTITELCTSETGRLTERRLDELRTGADLTVWCARRGHGVLRKGTRTGSVMGKGNDNLGHRTLKSNQNSRRTDRAREIRARNGTHMTYFQCTTGIQCGQRRSHGAAIAALSHVASALESTALVHCPTCRPWDSHALRSCSQPLIAHLSLHLDRIKLISNCGFQLHRFGDN